MLLPGRAGAQHPGQRLAGVVAVGQQRVVAEPLEIRLGSFLVAVAGHHRGIQPDAGHAVQHLVRDADAGQGAVPGRDAAPTPGAGPRSPRR